MEATGEKYDTRYLVRQIRRDEWRRRLGGVTMVAAIITAVFLLANREQESIMSRANRYVAVAPEPQPAVQNDLPAPAVAATAVQPAAPALFSDYVVLPGDTLAGIAEKSLCDRRLAALIEQVNRDVRPDPARS